MSSWRVQRRGGTVSKDMQGFLEAGPTAILPSLPASTAFQNTTMSSILPQCFLSHPFLSIPTFTVLVWKILFWFFFYPIQSNHSSSSCLQYIFSSIYPLFQWSVKYGQGPNPACCLFLYIKSNQATPIHLCIINGCFHATMVKENAWPTKPKLFTIWPFTEKVL